MTLLKNESFVPLTAAINTAENRDFMVTVIPQVERGQNFQSLEKSAVPSAESASPAFKKQNCEPQLSLQRDGDRITGIRIQCSCGQVMELACVYDPPAKAK
jgi:hypothetical protein